MILKAQKHSAEELAELDAGSIMPISIESSIEREKAASIKKLLYANDEIRIVSVVYPAFWADKAIYSNLDIAFSKMARKMIGLLPF